MDEKEQSYLTWFASNVDFGPAHDDVMLIMQNRYESETGMEVPEEWRYE